MMASLRWYYPGQVLAVGGDSRPLSPVPRAPAGSDAADRVGYAALANPSRRARAAASIDGAGRRARPRAVASTFVEGATGCSRFTGHALGFQALGVFNDTRAVAC